MLCADGPIQPLRKKVPETPVQEYVRLYGAAWQSPSAEAATPERRARGMDRCRGCDGPVCGFRCARRICLLPGSFYRIR